MRPRMIYAMLPALTIGLAGCATSSVETGRLRPPAEQLTCADEPISPGLITEGYLTDLRGAWADCRAKVDWLRDYWGR